jgi:hypothetical protein
MNLSFEDHPRNQESVEYANFIIVMNMDPEEQQSRVDFYYIILL